MTDYTGEPVPPCRPGCERCARALRTLGPVSYNNWRSWQMHADPPEVHPAPRVVPDPLGEVGDRIIELASAVLNRTKVDRRTSEQERIIAAQREKLEAMRAALGEALDGWQAALGIAYHDRMSDEERRRRARIAALRKVGAL